MNGRELHFDAIGYVSPAQFASSGESFPGLYDVTLEDGRAFRDLTSPQLSGLARRLNLDLRVAGVGVEKETTE